MARCPLLCLVVGGLSGVLAMGCGGSQVAPTNPPTPSSEPTRSLSPHPTRTPEATRTAAPTDHGYTSIETGRGPCTATELDGYVWVTSYNAGTVAQIDASTDTVVATHRVGEQACGIAAAAGALWVAGLG